MGVVCRIRDGLANVVTGMGTSADKSSHSFYTMVPLSRQQVEAAYRTSWLTRKIVDVPPFDMTRDWRDWQADAADIEAIEAEERRLCLRQRVRRALILSRLHGGGALILGVNQGMPADELHATVAFSRALVDWMKVGEGWEGDSKGEITINPGGARLVEPLGDKRAVVLLFNSSSLSWRHMAIREAGASWDFPEYQPHVTITYQGSDVDLTKVEPYRGKLVFGPEIFAEVTDDWKTTVTEE